MNKLKQRFQEDPVFALTVIGVGAIVLTGLLKATANTVTASAYAYRASKL